MHILDDSLLISIGRPSLMEAMAMVLQLRRVCAEVAVVENGAHRLHCLYSTVILVDL
jgi:hypothetical protein